MAVTHFIEVWRYKEWDVLTDACERISLLDKSLDLTIRLGGKTIAIFKIKLKR